VFRPKYIPVDTFFLPTPFPFYIITLSPPSPNDVVAQEAAA
jgi:hypothetical protein